MLDINEIRKTTKEHLFNKKQELVKQIDSNIEYAANIGKYKVTITYSLMNSLI